MAPIKRTSRSGIESAIVWQPMPPPASEPSGSRVEAEWGQPLQKVGARVGAGPPAARAIAASSDSSFCVMPGARSRSAR